MGASALAMEAAEVPVSMAVEVDMLVTKAFRYCSGARK
jgi:hypothetical protein